MFGGLAFMCRNRMCCGIVGNDLMVRVADDEFEAVMRQRHVRPVDFTGKPLKGFVYVPRPGFQTRAALRAWLARGERFVRQTPVSSAKSRARTRRSINTDDLDDDLQTRSCSRFRRRSRRLVYTMPVALVAAGEPWEVTTLGYGRDPRSRGEAPKLQIMALASPRKSQFISRCLLITYSQTEARHTT